MEMVKRSHEMQGFVILTHHAASRQAAMAPYGRMLLAREAGEPEHGAPP